MDGIIVNTDLDTSGFQAGSLKLQKAVSSLSKQVSSISVNMRKSFGGVIGSAKRLIPTIIGVGSAYGVLSKAVSAYMAQNRELSSSVQSCWTAIGNAIGPVINYVCNMLVTAVSYLMQFMRYMGLTSKSASEMGKAVGGAITSATTSIDELNVISDAGGGNGGGGLKDYEIPDWLKNIGDLLKQGAWEEAGKAIADKLNELVDSVDWTGLGDKIGYYFNGVISTLASVIRNFDWVNLGNHLGEGLNHFIDAVDWKNFGTVLAAKISIILQTLGGLLETLDLGKVAEAASDTVIGFIDEIDRAIRNIDWSRIGENLRKGFESIKWDEIWESLKRILKDGLEAVLDFAISALDLDVTKDKLVAKFEELFGHLEGIFEQVKEVFGMLWDEVLKPLVEWSIDEGLPTLLEKLGELIDAISEAIKAAKPYLEDFIERFLKPLAEFAWDTLLDCLDRLIKHIEDLTKVLNGEATFGDFIKGFDGIEGAIAAVLISFKAFKTGMKVFDAVEGVVTKLDKFKSVLGKVKGALAGGSGAAGAAEAGGSVAEAAEAAVTSIETIGEAAAEAATGATELGTAEAAVATAGSTLGAVISGAAGVVAGLAIGTYQGVKSLQDWNAEIAINNTSLETSKAYYQECADKVASLKQREDELANSGGDLTMVQDELTEWTTKLGKTQDYLIEQLKNSGLSEEEQMKVLESLGIEFDDTSVKVKDNAGKIKTSIVENFEESSDVVADKSNEMVETINKDSKSAADKTEEKSKSIWESISKWFKKSKDDMSSISSEANRDISAKEDDLVNTGNTKFSSFRDKVNNIFNDIKSKVGNYIQTMKSDATSNIDRMTSDMRSKFESGASSAKNAFQGMASSIQSTMSGLASSVSGIASSIGSTISGMISNISSGISNAWNSINNFASSAGQYVSNTMSNIYNRLSYHAVGGIVTRATHIGGGHIVGEDGAEAIIPLENHTEWIKMVSDGIVDDLLKTSSLTKLSGLFDSIPQPQIMLGSLIPPNATTNSDKEYFNAVINEIRDVMNVNSANSNELVTQVKNVINAVNGIDTKVYVGDKDIGYANDRYANKRGFGVNSGAFANAY